MIFLKDSKFDLFGQVLVFGFENLGTEVICHCVDGSILTGSFMPRSQITHTIYGQGYSDLIADTPVTLDKIEARLISENLIPGALTPELPLTAIRSLDMDSTCILLGMNCVMTHTIDKDNADGEYCIIQRDCNFKDSNGNYTVHACRQTTTYTWEYVTGEGNHLVSSEVKMELFDSQDNVVSTSIDREGYDRFRAMDTEVKIKKMVLLDAWAQVGELSSNANRKEKYTERLTESLDYINDKSGLIDFFANTSDPDLTQDIDGTPLNERVVALLDLPF